MKATIYSFFVCMLFCSCEDPCISYAKEYINEEYAFKIDTMYRPYASLTNWAYEGNGQMFNARQRGYFSGKVKTGDSIVKKKGELEVAVYKKDTMFIHYFSCGDGAITAKDLH
jgi:hypothetical protein